jgi:hypothetical protein
VAALMINISLSRTAGWAASRMLLIVTGLLPSIGLVICAVLVAAVTPSEGWPPRLMFLTYAAWIVAVAISLWHRSSANLHAGEDVANPSRPALA